MKISFSLLFSVCVLLCSACFAQAKSAAIAPSSGKALCSALTPADYTKAGVPVSSFRDANIQDGEASAYCTYNAKNGTLEFDISFPAGDDPASAKSIEHTVIGEVGGKFQPVPVPGADSAEISLAVPGKPVSASIVVRKKLAVFTINVPQSTAARQQLLALSQIVLGRLKHSR